MIVSTILKETRVTKTDLTQEQVAKKANISVRAYQQYEAGKRVPNARTAKLIASALNSTVEDLF